jgi:hypothetical protein
MKLKKQDWIFLFVVFLFSYLFYQHPLGLNLLLFNLVLISIQFLLRENSQIPFTLILCTLGTLSTAFAAVFINSTLAITANFVSFIAFTGFCTLSGSSFFISLINASYSMLASPFVHFARYVNGFKQEENSVKSSSQLKLYKLASFGIPIVVTVVFVILYSNANPVFANTIDAIKFDFISFEWLRFTFFGGLFLFGIIYFIKLDLLNQWDLQTSNYLTRNRNSIASGLHNLALKYEYKTGVILLSLLNIVILLFNIFDINLLLGGRLPEGYSYSEYVHQGVNTLIFSIILAILIILYFFRANLNFYSKNKQLIGLSYFWITQNIILAAGVIYKNHAYIIEYGLTYKRIGVYVYLALALFGLLTTIYKLKHHTNHWHLLRINSWVAYMVLVLFSFINWDTLITTFNLSLEKRPDYEYLCKLSNANLVQLISHEQKTGQLTLIETKLLQQKKTHFLNLMKEKSWHSWNYRDEINFELINSKND